MAWVAPVVSGVLSLAGSLMGRRRTQPPPNPEYDWMNKYGPQMWNKLGSEAYRMIDNPEGIPLDIRQRMQETARNTAESGYGAAGRGIARSAALAGLSPAGGGATRQQYYAGQQMAQDLNQAYGNIDIQDYLQRKENQNRGYNMLFSLSNKNPIYSQIAAQNYWNSLNASQESAYQMANALGGTAGNLTQYAMNQYPDTNRSHYSNPYSSGGIYRTTQSPNEAPQGAYQDVTNPYYSGYGG